MDIFKLAHIRLTLQKGKQDYTDLELINMAIEVRHRLDIQARNIKVARNRNK